MYEKGSYTFPFSRYPAVRIVIFLMVGILLGKAFSGGLYLPLGVFCLFITLSWILRKINPKSFLGQLTRSSNVLFLCLIIAFGWLRFSIHTQNKTISQTEELVSLMHWESVTVYGIITSYSFNAEGKQRADVHILETKLGENTSKEDYKARIIFDDFIEINLGDSLLFSATVIPISEKRNPHQFDYKKYLINKDIHVQLRLDDLLKQSNNQTRVSWNWWQNFTSSIIAINFSKKNQPLAKALLLGHKEDLDQETKKAFSRTGLSHIMAVSGLHVGFIIAPIWVLLPFMKRIKRGKAIGLMFVLLILYAYAGLTGFSASVMRASTTALFLTYGKLYNKSPNSINLTAAAAIFLLILNPNDLFSIGFQLSFSAVFIILLILPIIQHYIPYWIRFRWYSKPIMVILVSIVVQLGLYPLQAYYFGEISLISPISNALFVPFLGIFIPLAILGTMLHTFVEVLGYGLSLPLDFFLSWMYQFVTTVSFWEWSWVKVPSQTWLIFPCWLSFVFAISSLRIPPIRWKALIMGLFFIIVIQGQQLISHFQHTPLTITYFDVGQGDAALIQTPNGSNVLIDTGVWNPRYSSGKSVLLPHFAAEHITKLDAIILSHPHADHIGGMLDLIGSIDIDVIYNSGFKYESNLYRSYLQSAIQNEIKVVELKAGTILEIDESLLFLVLAPEGARFNDDPNEHSVVLEIIYGDTEFLFTGDSEEDQETRIVKNYSDILNTDVLKVGHHGSRTSSGDEFMAIATPDISIISLGEKNRFNHPHPEAVQRILTTETELLFTSRDKAVILKSDGSNIWREKWH